VQALERAAARGVRVRVLAEEKFYAQYPDTLERLARQKGVEVRRLDWKAAAGGGVLHAKYFVLDGREAVLGSQNFDWRSLAQIQELGVRFRAPAAVGALQSVFEADWAAALGERLPAPSPEAAGAAPALEAAGQSQIALVASPAHTLPAGVQWDLPALVRMLDSATKTVRVQVLTYRPTGRGGEPFTDLDAALRRAAERGVAVSLLVSDWAMGKGSLEHLRALALFGRQQRLVHRPGLSVKVLVIPVQGKCIPFARVAHAKYVAVDGAQAFISTSNWERDYFYESRNVGLVLSGGAVPQQVDAFFESTWRSAYAQEVTVEGPVPPVPDKSCGGAR
jgi:phosphatidylserine/phosphatidylglycerophosphate/cardiolipin synthase-like enzyme